MIPDQDEDLFVRHTSTESRPLYSKNWLTSSIQDIWIHLSGKRCIQTHKHMNQDAAPFVFAASKMSRTWSPVSVSLSRSSAASLCRPSLFVSSTKSAFWYASSVIFFTSISIFCVKAANDQAGTKSSFLARPRCRFLLKICMSEMAELTEN